MAQFPQFPQGPGGQGLGGAFRYYCVDWGFNAQLNVLERRCVGMYGSRFDGYATLSECQMFCENQIRLPRRGDKWRCVNTQGVWGCIAQPAELFGPNESQYDTKDACESFCLPPTSPITGGAAREYWVCKESPVTGGFIGKFRTCKTVLLDWGAVPPPGAYSTLAECQENCQSDYERRDSPRPTIPPRPR